MKRLLILSCSGRKNPAPGFLAAWDRYDGVFFRVCKKACAEGRFSPSVVVLIFSAKYGLIDADTPIENYDQKMTKNLAAAYYPQVLPQLRALMETGEYSEVFIVAGSVYRDALSPFFYWSGGVPVHFAEGGIGQQQAALKAWLQKVDEEEK